MIRKLSGFTIGEALLAGFVLTVGLVSVSALITGSLRNTFDTRDEITAIGLAQEGVELVRNVRDNNIAKNNPAFQGFATNGTEYCKISYDYMDTGSGLKSVCDGTFSGSDKYYLQYSAGYYTYPNPMVSGKFSRYTYVDYTVTDPQSALVRSFVWWGTIPTSIQTGDPADCTLANQCAYTEEQLTDWK